MNRNTRLAPSHLLGHAALLLAVLFSLVAAAEVRAANICMGRYSSADTGTGTLCAGNPSVVDVYVGRGGDVWFSIGVSGQPVISGYQIVFTYDASELEFVSASQEFPGSQPADTYPFEDFVTWPDVYDPLPTGTLAFVSLPISEVAGDLFQLRFRAVAPVDDGEPDFQLASAALLGTNETVDDLGISWNVIPAAACDDGMDNDGDGLFDLNDPGCASSDDESECDDTSGTAEIGRLSFEAPSFVDVELEPGSGPSLVSAAWDTRGTARGVRFVDVGGLVGSSLNDGVASHQVVPDPIADGTQVFGFNASGFDPGDSLEVRFGLPTTNAFLRCPASDCGPGTFEAPTSADFAGTTVTLAFSDGSTATATYDGAPGRNSLSSMVGFCSAPPPSIPLPASFEAEQPGSAPDGANVQGNATVERAIDFGGAGIEAPHGQQVAYLTTGGTGSGISVDITGDGVPEHDVSSLEIHITRGEDDPEFILLDYDVLTYEAPDGSYPDAFRLSQGGVSVVRRVGEELVDFSGELVVGPDGSSFDNGRQGFRSTQIYVPPGTSSLRFEVGDAVDSFGDTAVVIDDIRFLPEPGRLLQLAAGMVCLVTLGRRRARHPATPGARSE